MAEYRSFEELFKDEIAADEERRRQIEQLTEESAKGWQRALQLFADQVDAPMRTAAQGWIDHMEQMNEVAGRGFTDHLKHMGISFPEAEE